MSKILIIEDNVDVQENIAEILELSNYEVISADNGKEGIEKAFSELPDLIICDIMMPELDGFGVLKILSRDLRTRDIPFIFLTAKVEKVDFRKGMGLGADDYITKPFEDTDLLDAIEMRLNKRKRLLTHIEPALDSVVKYKKDIEQLMTDREIRKYRKKQHLFDEGDTANYLFFIKSGSVKTCMLNEYGKELITGIHKEGDFLGYITILQQTPYSEFAESLEKTEVILIPKSDFLSFIHDNKMAAIQFLKELARDVSTIEQKLLDIAYSSVRKRLARALISLSDQFKHPTIHISRENLANMIGTAKETLIRTLSEFKEDGYISVDQNDITLLQKEKLDSMPY